MVWTGGEVGYYEGLGGEGVVLAEVNHFCVVALGEEVGVTDCC
jgi:hypothetical protein